MKSIIPLSIIVVCVVAYFVYISPELQAVNNLRVKLAEYKTTLNQSKELKATLDSIQSSYQMIPGEDIAKLEKIIPNTFNNVLFVSDVNSIALRNSIQVKGVKISEGKSDQVIDTGSRPYNTVTATFTMTGQYEQFMRFLKDLESSLRLFDVKSLSVKQSQKTATGASSMEFLLEIDTYYLK